MYRFHIMEFKAHIKNMLVLFISTEITLVFSLMAILIGYYTSLCYKDALDDNSSHAMFDRNADQIGLCQLANYFMNRVKSVKAFSWQLTEFNFAILLTVGVFLLFDSPHDCFVCLGKDPDRIYSRF